MTSGAPFLRGSVCRGQFWLPGYSSQFLGVLDIELDDASDDSWRDSFVAWLYLAWVYLERYRLRKFEALLDG
jgi:hypothetical protein